MGYTHYWRMSRDFTDTEWLAIMEAACKIIGRARDTFKIPLAYECDQPDRKPEISSAFGIRFNGIGDDGHETFMFTKRMGPEPEWRKGEGHFAFCKTARKDYDAPVVAILIAAKEIAPQAFDWSSDGWLDEHADGLKLANGSCGMYLKWSNAHVEADDNDPGFEKRKADDENTFVCDCGWQGTCDDMRAETYRYADRDVQPDTDLYCPKCTSQWESSMSHKLDLKRYQS